MTLGLENVSQKKLIFYNFCFKVKLIELYKRDYFFPFFSEVFRRKGLIALAKKIDFISSQLNLQILVLDLLIDTLAPYSCSLVSSRFPSEKADQVLDAELFQLLMTYKTALRSSLTSEFSLSQSLEVFLFCLESNFHFFSLPKFLNFQQKMCTHTRTHEDYSFFFKTLVGTEMSHKEAIERIVLKC